jgi:hypothetical protein
VLVREDVGIEDVVFDEYVLVGKIVADDFSLEEDRLEVAVGGSTSSSMTPIVKAAISEIPATIIHLLARKILQRLRSYYGGSTTSCLKRILKSPNVNRRASRWSDIG